MRYFIISLAINIAILFIPLKSDEILSKKTEENKEIKVVLNLQKEQPKQAEILPEQPQPQPEIIEPEILPEPIIEPEPIVEPEILPEPVIKPEIKPKPNPEIKKAEKPKDIKKPKPKKQIKKPEKKIAEEIKELTDTPVIQEPVPPVEQPQPLYVPQAKESNIDKESYCKENIGFKVLKEPRADYPKKAIMLRLKDTFYVEVDFKVTNGDIQIVSVRGKNKIFNDEAAKITKEMQISVLKDINHCIITKPYEFKIKD